MERFSGRVAIVTGVSSGIGEAIAEDLVKAGMQVVGIARRIHLVQELAQRLSDSDQPGKLHPLQVDLSDSRQVIDSYQWIENKFGAIDVVVNNAAMCMTVPLKEADTEQLNKMVTTNYTNLAISCREAINNMKKFNVTDGHIININSIMGHSIPYFQGFSLGLYGGTKHAVTALCKVLRQEAMELEGFKIRVTSISPGGVDTDMLPTPYAEVCKATGKPLLKAADVSRAVLFAISSPPDVEIVELTIQPTGEPI